METGVVVQEAYRLDGRLHRDPNEGPAYVYRDPETGVVCEERYCWHGRLHREGGPAKVSYGGGGTVMLDEMYYRHGLLHRDPKLGPAYFERNDDGVAFMEVYYFNGSQYRDPADGPHLIARYDDGRIEAEEYSEPGQTPPPRRPASKRRGPEPAP